MAYDKVQDLMKDIGGKMKWVPGSGPGGAWELTLHGKTAPPVELRGDNTINALDRLYVPQVENPKTTQDFGSPGELRPDAFWRLVSLFPR